MNTTPMRATSMSGVSSTDIITTWEEMDTGEHHVGIYCKDGTKLEVVPNNSYIKVNGCKITTRQLLNALIKAEETEEEEKIYKHVIYGIPFTIREEDS
jgi:hypothetical protein